MERSWCFTHQSAGADTTHTTHTTVRDLLAVIASTISRVDAQARAIDTRPNLVGDAAA